MSHTIEMHEEFRCSRSPIDVFTYITDFSRIDEWDQTISSAQKRSPGAITLGTQFSLIYTLGPKRIPIEYEITRFEPNHSAVLVGKAKNFTATDTIQITPMEQGCHVSWQAVVQFTGASSSFVPLVKKKIITSGRQTIRNLANALEDNYPLPRLSILKSIADTLVIPGIATFTKYGYTFSKKNWNPVTNNVQGQHMVITGATSGLGLVTAYALAHRGATLTLVARDKVKAESVKSEIVKQTGNGNINLEIADLSEIGQTIDLAKRLNSSGTPIDVLINNAGALLNRRLENSEGIETSFSLLLLSPVILTELLKPLLGKRNVSRVINVSSGGMYAKGIELDNLESTQGSYSGAAAYARSKRGLVLAGQYWAKHWSKDRIIVHNMHPGWAQTPGVEKSLPEFNKKMQRTLRTPEQGADTIIWLACASEVVKKSGLFWLDRQPHSIHLTKRTQESAATRQQLFIKLREYGDRFSVKLELGDESRGEIDD